MTQPKETVERVAVGSFDKASPFYQKNLNDLTPFGYLYIRRLDVYPLVDTDCTLNTGMIFSTVINNRSFIQFDKQYY